MGLTRDIGYRIFSKCNFNFSSFSAIPSIFIRIFSSIFLDKHSLVNKFIVLFLNILFLIGKLNKISIKSDIYSSLKSPILFSTCLRTSGK